ERFAELKARLERAAGAVDEEARLVETVDSLADQWLRASRRLSKSRGKAAAVLGKTITGFMRELGMAEGRFEVSVSADESIEPRIGGIDGATFLVSANAGQPPRPLARVASGGELSRIGLAIRVSLAGDRVHTLIFDEVDSGVGGSVAALVGDRLRDLAADQQVLCVTHLPQVASRGHQHCRVEKTSVAGETRTAVIPLGDDERVEEIARMLGGREITDTTRDHAREMLAAPADA
ncbi:MAG: DNA repair protein RecN, partial [Pseudomonadota bacterium]